MPIFTFHSHNNPRIITALKFLRQLVSCLSEAAASGVSGAIKGSSSSSSPSLVGSVQFHVPLAAAADDIHLAIFSVPATVSLIKEGRFGFRKERESDEVAATPMGGIVAG